MTILLIEDDEQTAGLIAQALRDSGHVVDVAHDGNRGLALAASNAHDLLIIDRMLPGIDGLALLKAARVAGIQAPVLMLTAMGAIEDRVAGLKAGADDYVVKPFSVAELRARVDVLLRRPPLKNDDQSVLRVDNLSLDRIRRTVTRGGEIIDLQPRQFRLLEELMLSAGQVVTRTMLLERVWEFEFDTGTNIVQTHISHIRAKIDRGADPPLIHTVRGAGYVLRKD